MKLRQLALALGLAGLVSACDQSPLTPHNQNKEAAQAAASYKDDSPVLAKVNGIPLTENMFVLYQTQRQNRRPTDPASQNRKAILDEIISLELARQEGEKQGVGNKPEVQLQIDQQRRAVIAAATIQEQLKQNPVSDEELKKIYDEKIGQGTEEYRARHILVKDEEKARSLIKELDAGADFSELAKEHSTGPSGKKGGDLGWFSGAQMVKPFSDAVAAMEKGSYTKDPVQTQFGWHVIILDDVRKTTPPPFEQVKPQIQALVQSQRVQSYIQGLKEKASIEILEEEAPAAAENTETAGATETAPAAEK